MFFLTELPGLYSASFIFLSILFYWDTHLPMGFIVGQTWKKLEKKKKSTRLLGVVPQPPIDGFHCIWLIFINLLNFFKCNRVHFLLTVILPS